MSWQMIASAAMQMAPSLLSAFGANNNDADQSNLDVNFKPYMDKINKIGEKGLEMTTPGSAYNVQEDKRIKSDAYDAMGVADMLSGRGIAKGGMGGYSGITNQWAQADLAKRHNELRKTLLDSRMAREAQGYNLIAQAAEGDQYMGALKTQRDISKPQFDLGGTLQNIGTGAFDYWMGQQETVNPIVDTIQSMETPNFDVQNMFPNLYNTNTTTNEPVNYFSAFN